MQRLYSTFPCGPPGAALLLIRLVVAIPLIHAGLETAPSSAAAIVDIVAALAAALLLIGLWTPIAGAVIAVLQLGLAWFHPADPWMFLHLGVLGAGLAMLGPGGCSVDARLFGLKKIQIPER